MLIPAGFVTRLARRLTNLAGEYADRLGERRAHVLLKRDHTLRVHALAAHIARAENSGISGSWAKIRPR